MTPDSGHLIPEALVNSLGAGKAIEVIPITSGWGDTAIWRVEAESGTYALRLFRPDAQAGRTREVVAMQLAGTGGVPVPRVHASGTWERRPYLLLSWCPSQSLGDDLAFISAGALAR